MFISVPCYAQGLFRPGITQGLPTDDKGTLESLDVSQDAAPTSSTETGLHIPAEPGRWFLPQEPRWQVIKYAEPTPAGFH